MINCNISSDVLILPFPFRFFLSEIICGGEKGLSRCKLCTFSSSGGDIVQDLAKEKFQLIQEAYEYLEKIDVAAVSHQIYLFSISHEFPPNTFGLKLMNFIFLHAAQGFEYRPESQSDVRAPLPSKSVKNVR